MSSKSEQHQAFFVYILIILDGIKKVLEFGPVARERDENDVLIALSKSQSVQQTMHAAICRLWSNWDSTYADEAYADIKGVVIPTLQKFLNTASLDWAENLSFRRVKKNAKGEIYFSSGVFNPDTGEWDNCWLTEAKWLEMQGFRSSALFSTTNDVASPEPVKVTAEPIKLDFLNVVEETSTTKKSSK